MRLFKPIEGKTDLIFTLPGLKPKRYRIRPAIQKRLKEEINSLLLIHVAIGLLMLPLLLVCIIYLLDPLLIFIFVLLIESNLMLTKIRIQEILLEIHARPVE